MGGLTEEASHSLNNQESKFIEGSGCFSKKPLHG